MKKLRFVVSLISDDNDWRDSFAPAAAYRVCGEGRRS
jgi:hypothetical protein